MFKAMIERPLGIGRAICPLSHFYMGLSITQSPYYIYGGTQDNNSWAGPSRTISVWHSDLLLVHHNRRRRLQVASRAKKIRTPSTLNPKRRQSCAMTGARRKLGIQPHLEMARLAAREWGFHPSSSVRISTHGGLCRRTVSSAR